MREFTVVPPQTTVEGHKHIVALIFGEVGTGKTGMIGSFPKPRVLDTDGRAHRLLPRLYPGKEITYAQFREEAIDSRGIIKTTAKFAFDDVCRMFDKWTSQTEQGKWLTLVVDTGTTLTSLANNKAIVLNQKYKLSQTHATAKAEGVIIPKIQDFGTERSLIEQFVEMCAGWCLDHSKHFLFMCHEKQEMNDAGSVTTIKPLLTGRGAVSVPGMFSEVWNLKVEGSGPGLKRYLQTERDGLRVCRSDLGFPNRMVATFDAIQSGTVVSYKPLPEEPKPPTQE